MTLYSSIILILLFLFLIEIGGTTKLHKKYLFLLSSFLVFFLMAFRGIDVGGDTLEYVHFWEGQKDVYGTWEKPDDGLVNEPGLSWLCHILHLFNDGSPWFFIFSESLIVLLPFHFLVWRDSVYKVLPNLLFMVMWALLDVTFTGLRQVLGISFLIIAYIIWTSRIQNRKLKIILSISLVLFGICFHVTVVFVALIYLLLYNIKSINKKWPIVVLVLSYFMVFAGNFIMTAFLPAIENYFFNAEGLFRLYHYFSEDLNDSLSIYQFLGTALVCLFVFLSKDQNDYNYFYINCLIFGCAFLNVFSFFPNIARITEPFLFLGILSSPCHICLKKMVKVRLLFLIIIMVFSIKKIIYWENEYSNKSSPSYLYSQMFPYKFVWE